MGQEREQRRVRLPHDDLDRRAFAASRPPGRPAPRRGTAGPRWARRPEARRRRSARRGSRRPHRARAACRREAGRPGGAGRSRRARRGRRSTPSRARARCRLAPRMRRGPGRAGASPGAGTAPWPPPDRDSQERAARRREARRPAPRWRRAATASSARTRDEERRARWTRGDSRRRRGALERIGVHYRDVFALRRPVSRGAPSAGAPTRRWHPRCTVSGVQGGGATASARQNWCAEWLHNLTFFSSAAYSCSSWRG